MGEIIFGILLGTPFIVLLWLGVAVVLLVLDEAWFDGEASRRIKRKLRGE